MKKRKFAKGQIIGFLKRADAGMPIKELCRNGGFSDATLYKWRAKFGGMQVSEMQRLRELELSGCWQRLTLTCARSRVFWRVKRYGAITMANALKRTVTMLPVQLWQSSTWDRGNDLSDHARFTTESGVKVFFADSDSPWWRGNNENTNGLLR